MPKRPRNLNQLAKLVAEIATTETDDPLITAKCSPQLRGQAGEIKARTMRTVKLSSEQPKLTAMKATDARWRGKAKKN